MSKDFLLNESKVFCVLPWIHMMIMPPGDVYPCCVGVDSSKFGSVNDGDFSSIINNENFKTLRANMLAEKQTPFCNGCYEFEKHGSSFRQYNNEIFKQHIDEIVSNTKEDGYLENFKMRYSDIRFRNICNFKCRTCGPEYSTAWALEENKFENTKHKVFDIKTTSNVMPELLERIDDIEMFYFAGGEPLITDEHYVILEELIRKKRTNVKIRYNTNCSVLQYKNKDIFDLWKHFDSISVSASIDHIEERAEYIRSGTEWGIIDRNLKLLRDTPNVELSVNTVLSVFNYSTLDILYDYLKNIGIFHNKSWYNSITNTERPSYFSATILPKICKDMGTERLTKLMERLANDGYTSQIQLFKNAIEFANSKDDWETERASFVDEIAKKDKQRNESFVKTFPELKPMWSRIMDIDKDYLLNESKTFCMFPWVHLNVTPKGDIYPCCSNDYTKPYGNTKEMTLKQAFNSEGMKKLRLDMLNERKNDMCNFCYKHEEAGPHSFRNYSKEHFGKQFDSLVPTTQEDGTVEEFRMHYFDIRFSNICNFKCRTCGSEFSSQWGLEMNKNYDSKHPILIHADDNKGKLLDEVLGHVHHIDLAYFAGGEPLITEEHYVILEEMIRKGHTDITLRYNTNASNIKYKNHDVLDLWKHFDRIELSCSVDHYGERAELLRNGTDWGKVESNLLTFRDLDYVSFQMNTVFSIFNYLTIGEFYQYLQDKNIVRREDWYHSLYLAVHPIYYSAKSLPKSLKPLAQEKALRWADANETNNTCLPRLVRDAVNFANDGDSWGEVREKFLGHTKSLDRIRDESFWKIFPELNSLSELLE